VIGCGFKTLGMGCVCVGSAQKLGFLNKRSLKNGKKGHKRVIGCGFKTLGMGCVCVGSAQKLFPTFFCHTFQTTVGN